jgi:hypothetical protein
VLLPSFTSNPLVIMASRKGNRNMSKKRIRSSQSKAAIDAALQMAQQNTTIEEEMAEYFADNAEERGLNAELTDRSKEIMQTLMKKAYPVDLAASIAVQDAAERVRINAPNIVASGFTYDREAEPNYADFNYFLDQITPMIDEAIPAMHSVLWPEGTEEITRLVKTFRKAVVKSERDSPCGSKADAMRLSLSAAIALTHELATAYIKEVREVSEASVQQMRNLVKAGLIKPELMTPEFMDRYFPGSQSGAIN